jgi:DNA repair protein RecO (recombination protein O)
LIVSSQGIILKIFPYSNTSIICNVFTKDRGKLTFIAKGIRKPKNPLLSILQPFNLLEFNYYYKKNRSMHLIKEADILFTFNQLRNNLSTILIGSTILNIINRVFEEEYPQEVIFRLTYKVLSLLPSNKKQSRILFIFYLFHLSKQLGVMPNIERCYSCNAVFNHDVIFSLGSSSLICSSCNINSTLDTDFIISHTSLMKCMLINITHINSIMDIEISSLQLKELFNFLIAFMNSNINHMHKIKGIKEITKIYHNE